MQKLCHLGLIFDWLFVTFFDHLPITMLNLLPILTELPPCALQKTGFLSANQNEAFLSLYIEPLTLYIMRAAT